MSSVSFDQASEYYDATRGYPPGVEEHIADALVSAAEATPTTRFLELGIGTGRIAFPLLQRGYKYAGIDLSDAMMDQLRKKITAFAAAHPEHAPLQVDLQVGDSTHLPYPDACVDVVLTVHVLHLIPNWQMAIDEALRVLTPGGVYLNGSDDALSAGSHREIQTMWMEIVRRLGFDMGPTGLAGYVNVNAALHYLQQGGLQPERLRTAAWQVHETPRQALHFITQRLWSRTWAIPDAIFTASAEELERAVMAHFGNKLDTPELREMQFSITRVRKP